MRILVSAASKHHATAEIAEAISEVLRGRGFEVADMAPAQVVDIETYDAFVLGSGVYVGSWLKAEANFVKSNAATLSSRPVWLFSSGPLDGKPEEPVDESKIGDLIEMTGAIEHVVFSGKIDRAELGIAEKLAVKVVGAPEGDFREWDQIRAWANSIADHLSTIS